MKNLKQSKKSKEAQNATRILEVNTEKLNFKDFLANREAKQTEADKVRQERSQTRSTVKTLNMSQLVLLDILNAGLKGITTDELFTKGLERKANDGKGIARPTLDMAWNNQSKFVQRGELALTCPYKVNTTWNKLAKLETLNDEQAKLKAEIETDMGKPLAEVVFEVVRTKSKVTEKPINRVYIGSQDFDTATQNMVQNNLELYLISQGAKEIDFIL